jgi:hypothetical protein
VIATSLVAATAADYVTTYRALDKCPTCKEANPIMAPLIPHKRTLAGVQISFDLGMLYMAYRDRKKGYKYWYLGPWILTWEHTLLALNNERIARKESKR